MKTDRTDYHDFSHRGTSKEKRDKLAIGNIYVNAAICKLCDYFVRSCNRHDFVTCKCGNVSVDGGSWYAKRLVSNPMAYEDVIELYDDAKIEQTHN